MNIKLNAFIAFVVFGASISAETIRERLEKERFADEQTAQELFVKLRAKFNFLHKDSYNKILPFKYSSSDPYDYEYHVFQDPRCNSYCRAEVTQISTLKLKSLFLQDIINCMKKKESDNLETANNCFKDISTHQNKLLNEIDLKLHHTKPITEQHKMRMLLYEHEVIKNTLKLTQSKSLRKN